MKVFLGGTCNESTWRDRIIQMLTIDFFNPVVPDWTPECQTEEIRQRKECDFILYVITPKMTGVYAIAEAVDDSNKRHQRTFFHYLIRDEQLVFTEGQIRSLRAVANLIEANGATVCVSLDHCADAINKRAEVFDNLKGFIG